MERDAALTLGPGQPDIGVVVADHHPLYLDALRRLISSHPHLRLVGAAASGLEALAAIRHGLPDVAVLEAGMSDFDGPSVAARLRLDGASTRVLLISERLERETVYAAMLQGASGFVTKAAGGETIVSAIERVAAGEAVLSGEAQTMLVGRIREQNSRGGPVLTDRERQVLELAAIGLSNREIAARILIGHETVKSHLHTAYEKLEVSTRAAAVSVAIARGIMKPPLAYT